MHGLADERTAPFPWSLREIESMVRAGDLSPVEIVERAGDRLALTEPSIAAFCQPTVAAARREARALESRLQGQRPISPLHGVPVAVKDIFDTAGVPTEWGSPTQAGRTPESDCELVARLKSLGCIVLGKTVTTAFAYFDTGPTRNPRNTACTPGGSSSGSAAAVAAGVVPLAIGSQTQGSVLRPASFCGIVGFKPTRGRLPLAGVMPFAPTLDHAGLFTATVPDMAVAWRALGFAARAELAKSITFLNWSPPGLDRRMETELGAAADTLAWSGLEVMRADPPDWFRLLPAALRTVMAREAADCHGATYRLHGPKVGAKLAALLEEGLAIGKRQYREALAVITESRAAFSAWSRAHPVVAAPAALGPAPRGLGSSGDPACNAPFTALGAPAITVPLPVPRGAMPLGLQLAAAPGRDAPLLVAADACEKLL